MRTYKYTDSPQEIKDAFSFLEQEYGYTLIEESIDNFGPIYVYASETRDIRVNLNYDYKDNFFYFKLIRGKNTRYPNDRDFENIKPFFRLTQKYEPNLHPNKLQPDENQYREALRLNAEILKKYGDKILKGEEWF